MNKVFITGGAGFIGNHLTRTLLEQGKHVTVYDALLLGFNRLADLLDDGNITFIKGNIRDKDLLTRSMEGHDMVIHLAANTDIPSGLKNTSLDLLNCTVGTWNVLEAMVQNKISDLLFSSTAAVYGVGGESSKLGESYGPLHPISLYGAGKLACEGFISAYSNLFGIHACIYRFGNVVGGGMDHGVIYDLIHRLRKDSKKLAVWGDGNGEKPFFLVEDCIRGMLAMYNYSCEETFKGCEIFNLGCTSRTKISQVVDTVLDEMGLKGTCEIQYQGTRIGFPGDVPIVDLDVRKADSIGWRTSCDSTTAVGIAARKLISEARMKGEL